MSEVKKYDKIPQNVEDAASGAVDSAFHVHKKVGPGLLEKVYERFMTIELMERGCNVQRQVKLPIVYNGHEYDEYYTIDLLVDNCLIIELKTVETILPIHRAQLLTYLRLSEKRLGLLINFNETNIGKGISRVIN